MCVSRLFFILTICSYRSRFLCSVLLPRRKKFNSSRISILRFRSINIQPAARLLGDFVSAASIFRLSALLLSSFHSYMFKLGQPLFYKISVALLLMVFILSAIRVVPHIL